MTWTDRTWLLTERVPRACRLHPTDVDFLQMSHRSHLELMPTGQRHVYRVTATTRVGVLVAPHCRLILRPKIPWTNLFYLLDPEQPPNKQDDATTPQPGTEALAFLANRFLRLLRERVVLGLQRGYVERQHQGPTLLGRLDLETQRREPPGRKERLASRYEEWTANLPCNQVLRTTLEVLVRHPLLPNATTAGFRNLLPYFDEVGTLPSPWRMEPIERDRQTESYRPLLDLCRLLLDGLEPGTTTGATVGPAFLLDLERLFERHVAVVVRETFADRAAFAVEAQPEFEVAQPVGLRMRPDVVVLQEGKPIRIVDAKWKRLRDGIPEPTDLHQVLAYAAALAVERTALVYPGKRTRCWTYRLANAPIRLDVWTLRVVGAAERCRAARRRLEQGLRTADT